MDHYVKKQYGVIRKSSLYNACLLLFLTISLNSTWNMISVLWWGSVGLLILSFFLSKGNGSIVLYDYTKWMLLFTILCILSIFVALDKKIAIDRIKNLFVILVSFTVVRNQINSNSEILNTLKFLYVAIGINAVYLLSKMDLSLIGSVQIGNGTNEGWNGNAIGIMMAMGVLIGIYLIECGTSKLWTKILIIIATILYIYISLFTGSRKALFFLVVGISCYFLSRAPKKIIKNAIIIVSLVYVAYYSIMNNPKLYAVLGWRMEGLLAYVSGIGKVDHSTILRNEYIQNGFTWIKENPILGYGIDNYRVLNSRATGHMTYSHNNLIEIAFSLGVGGLVIYYAPFIYICYKLVRKTAISKLAAVLFSMFGVYLLCHYGMVTYYEPLQNLLLCICFSYIYNAPHSDEELVHE